MHILVAIAVAVAARAEPDDSKSSLARTSAMRRRTLRHDDASSGGGFSSGLTCKYRPSARAELIVSSGMRHVRSKVWQYSSAALPEREAWSLHAKWVRICAKRGVLAQRRHRRLELLHLLISPCDLNFGVVLRCPLVFLVFC